MFPDFDRQWSHSLELAKAKCSKNTYQTGHTASCRMQHKTQRVQTISRCNSSHPPLFLFCYRQTAVLMGTTWQLPEHKAFIREHLASYTQHKAAGTENTVFWPEILEKWFKEFPPSEPTPELIEEHGSLEAAKKVTRAKRVAVSVIVILVTLSG